LSSTRANSACQIVEERSRLTAINHQLVALREELAAQQRAAASTHYRAPAALEEARAKYEEASAVARAGAEEAKRLTTLHAEGLVSEMEAIRAQAEAKKRQAAASALSFAINLQDKDQNVRESDRQVEQENLKREMAALEGEIMTKTATIERLQQTMGQRSVVASASGRIGEVADLRVGSVVREGDKLGAIVPRGTLRIIADLPPSSVFGRIRAGQPASLRLQGFPWTEYGKVTATVTSVGSEPRSGEVRVELTIDPNPPKTIPLQHGLPGSIEIEVERASPAALALRAVGRSLAQNKTQTQP
jgi:membrane fusion protein (multidrug efflux system)